MICSGLVEMGVAFASSARQASAGEAQAPVSHALLGTTLGLPFG